MNNLRYVLFFALLAGIGLLLVNFSFHQDNFISVVGRAVYNTREYPTQKVKVYVTEDGKSFKTFYCDEKGRFETKVQLNHNYMFHFSMDYHATSKVLVDTRMPKEYTEGDVGGLFSFDCEMFERMDGLNLSILNNPLVKIKFNPEKNDFQYDKAYTEKILFNLEGFKEQLAEMKQRRKKVLKEAVANETSKSPEVAEEVERKPIIFEEPAPKKAVNKHGHRNIMDQFEEEDENESAVREEVFAVTPVDTEKTTISQSATAGTVPDVKNLKAEELALEAEIDESEFTALKVIPKRIEVTTSRKVIKEEPDDQLELIKMKIQEIMEAKRVGENTKMREQVTSYNFRNYKIKEMRLANQKIQVQRMRSMIKTIALAEIYYKKAYYRQHPINHSHFIPAIAKHSDDGFWKSSEEVMIRYPSSVTMLKKVTYLFGISYYYRNGEEIDEDIYCSSLALLSSNEYSCVQ